MRITTKGQVTIPVEIRELLGLLPGTNVEFVVDGRDVRLRKSDENGGRGRALVERMAGRGDVELTTDEIMALTRE